MVFISTQVPKLSTSYNFSNTFWPASIQGYDRLIFLLQYPRKQVLRVDYIRKNYSQALGVPFKILLKNKNDHNIFSCNTRHRKINFLNTLKYRLQILNLHPHDLCLQIPLSSAYFRVRNGNRINFSIFIISDNQIGWQHFRWPFWPSKGYCMSDTVKKKEGRVGNTWYFKHGLTWFGSGRYYAVFTVRSSDHAVFITNFPLSQGIVCGY